MQPLVDFPSPRTCPDDVLQELRAIDPAAELVYAGFGSITDPDTGEELFGPRWILGAVNADRAGRHKALDEIGRIRQRFALEMHIPGRERAHLLDRLRLLRLYAQGFAPIQTYLVRDPDGSIVRDFAFADWCYRTDPDGQFERVADYAEGGHIRRSKLARIRDAVSSEGASVHAHTMRGRVTSSGSGRYSQFRGRPAGRSLYAN